MQANPNRDARRTPALPKDRGAPAFVEFHKLAQIAHGTILGTVGPFLASNDRFGRKRNHPQSLYLCGWKDE